MNISASIRSPRSITCAARRAREVDAAEVELGHIASRTSSFVQQISLCMRGPISMSVGGEQKGQVVLRTETNQRRSRAAQATEFQSEVEVAAHKQDRSRICDIHDIYLRM